MERKRKMRRWIAVLLCLGLLWIPARAVAGTPSDWAKDEVEQAVQAGLVPQLTGDPAYQETLTREQFAQLVVQTVEVMLGRQLTAAPAGTFTDCETPAVLKASEAGIIGGIGGGKFAPEQTTNREQIATMMARAIDYLEENSDLSLAPKAGSLEGFTDAAQVSSWAAETMGRMAANGIMEGSGSALSPQNPCTVEQGILLLARLYDLGADAGPALPPAPTGVGHYADYPMVPDFGDMIGYTGEITEGSQPQYNTVFYQYIADNASSEETYRLYWALLVEEGFTPVYMWAGMSSIYYYNPNCPDLVVSYKIAGENTVWISLTSVEAPAGSPVCYPDFAGDVPDLAACVGLELLGGATAEDGSWVAYYYEMPNQADHTILAPWFIRMSQTDYVLKGMMELPDSFATVWRDSDTGDSVAIYEQDSYLTVMMVSGDS